MAKGRDHETVRALETQPKGIPLTIEIDFFVLSRAFKCSIKTYATGLSSICYFMTILFM
jgi:hypothetical protein